MLSTSNYRNEQQAKTSNKTEEMLKELPEFVEDFFIGQKQKTSANTRLAYAYDIRIFLKYIYDKKFKDCYTSIAEITLNDLNNLSPKDIEKYLEYLSYYKTEDNIEHHNGENGKARKLTAIKTMFHFFYRREELTYDATSFVDLPKMHEKTIIKLDVDEIAKLLDEVESGEKLTAKQKVYHEYTKKRDLAIVALLLGTGMRVSECVGINIDDVDFEYNGVKITRKGGNESIVYFGEEVEEILKQYLTERNEKPCLDEDKPLFLSMQNKRISVRSVQKLVKKYSQLVTNLKKITPHKLRSTYGTQLYQETGDIYLVADVLGHKDVNTTKKHYAQMDDQRRKAAAKFIKLRED